MLKGKFIKMWSGQYGFEHISQSSLTATETRLVWPMDNLTSRGMCYCTVDEAVGKDACYVSDIAGRRVDVYVGNGGYIVGTVAEQAQICETTAVVRPKLRPGVEARWHHNGYRGYWQKYLKTKGWVEA